MQQLAMFVEFVYATESQHATAQSQAATLLPDKVARQNRAIKSRDKIASVTLVLVTLIYFIGF